MAVFERLDKSNPAESNCYVKFEEKLAKAQPKLSLWKSLKIKQISVFERIFGPAYNAYFLTFLIQTKTAIERFAAVFGVSLFCWPKDNASSCLGHDKQ